MRKSPSGKWRGYTASSVMKREDLLDLNDALQHPGRVIAVDISTELADEADLDLLRPVEGFLEAVSTGNLLLIKGEFTAKVVIECARCLHPLEQEIAFTIDEQFPVEGTPSMYNPQDYARVVSDEPYELFEGNNLMVEALLRQGLILGLPLQALCEHGWDGDCPLQNSLGNKGKTKNDGSPFAKLQELIEPKESQD